MTQKGSKVILIGGTGATGKFLISELINSHLGFEVTSLVRKIDTTQNDKVKQVIVDFDNLENYKSEFAGKDIAFNVFGTTKKQAGSNKRFREIELGYSSKFAEIAKESNINSMFLLTSGAANPNSFMFYLQVKGEIEEKYKQMNFHHLSLFRPGYLNRGRNDRWFDSVFGKIFSGYKVETLAKAMKIDAENVISNNSEINTFNSFTGANEIDKLITDNQKNTN